jgi:hypothetical protein
MWGWPTYLCVVEGSKADLNFKVYGAANYLTFITLASVRLWLHVSEFRRNRIASPRGSFQANSQASETRNLEETMSTRREFIQTLPAVGTAFAVAGQLVLDDRPANAQTQSPAPTPLKGHFHPKGKAPSKYTLDALKQARTGLPFTEQGTSTSRSGALSPP